MSDKPAALISKKTISTTRAAGMLGVCVDTIVNWITEDKLRGFQFAPGGRWHVSYDSVVDLAARMNRVVEGELPPT